VARYKRNKNYEENVIGKNLLFHQLSKTNVFPAFAKSQPLPFNIQLVNKTKKTLKILKNIKQNTVIVKVVFII
jgi:hypothetical protein